MLMVTVQGPHLENQTQIGSRVYTQQILSAKNIHGEIVAHVTLIFTRYIPVIGSNFCAQMWDIFSLTSKTMSI